MKTYSLDRAFAISLLVTSILGLLCNLLSLLGAELPASLRFMLSAVTTLALLSLLYTGSQKLVRAGKKKNGTKNMDMSERIERIKKMEAYFDVLQEAFEKDPEQFFKDPDRKAMYECLIAYYESGDWMADYECDAEGSLPSDLKRGVLSEDGVYNFLCSVEDMEKREV